MKTRSFFIGLIALKLLMGSLVQTINKTQGSFYVYEGPYYKSNFHPYILVATMFLGMFLCLPIYHFLKRKYPEQHAERQRQSIQQGKIVGMNKLLLLIPTVFDLLTSALHFLALNYVPVSAHQMMIGGDIVTCFIFSFIFFQEPLHKAQILGSILTVIGLVVVASVNLLLPQQTVQTHKIDMEKIGYFLLVVSMFTNGLFYTIQEKLMEIYHLQPLQVVGYEGMFGLFISILSISVLSSVPCYFGVDACVYDSNGQPYIQRWDVFFSEIFENNHLLFINLIWILFIGIYNPLAVSTTKYMSSLARALSDVCQTSFVWIIGIFVTLTTGLVYPNFHWQKIDAKIIGLQFIGFAIIVLGNISYNYVYIQKEKQKEQRQYKKTKQTKQINYQMLVQDLD